MLPKTIADLLAKLEVKALDKLSEKLGDLSDEQITEVQSVLMAGLDELGEDLSDENLKSMDELASAIMGVRETISAREEDRSARQDRAAEIRSRVTTPAAPEGEESDEGSKASESRSEGSQADSGTEGAQASQEGSEGDSGASEGSEKAVPEPVAASGSDRPSIQELASRRPESMAPRSTEPNQMLTITAGADVPGFSAGTQYPDSTSVGKALADKMDALKGSKVAEGSRYKVATLSLDYPSDRVLEEGQDGRNTEKIMSVVSPPAIVAAGGLCAPTDAHYGLANISSAARPVRDALPKFNARRGGIRYITPPTLSDLEGAVGYVTEADDVSGYPPADKPIATITCGTEQEVVINAVTLRLQTGRFSRMTFPEQFPVWYDLGLAQHARIAEGRLLSAISTNSTAVTDGQNLGLARDLLECHGRHIESYRNVHRTDPDIMLQIFVPRWVVGAFCADLVRQSPGDGLEVWNLTRQQIEGWYRNRGAAVTWYLDSRIGGDQLFPVQVAGPGTEWLATVEAYLFHPGAFLFVDGGTLDLGIDIIDTTTIATNDLQSFMETFENVAYLGVESRQIRSSICVNGAAAGVVDPADLCTGS